ncbi:non-ribosomal peptide synthetase [Gorillibacterium sp. sgz500922]|uniref:non-ribosomal peptide synthetase n=1 Tax=Gorillibacterium sp. sgz500922 TaxID=3446694 RepID=UPI003F674B80
MKAILTHREDKQAGWLPELAGLPQLSLPADYPRRPAGSRTAEVSIRIEAEDKEFAGLAQWNGRELLGGVLALYFGFLQRMTLESDLLIGLQTEDGGYAPLRLAWEKEMTFEGLFRQVQTGLGELEVGIGAAKTQAAPNPGYAMLYGTAGLPGEDGIRLWLDRGHGGWTLTAAYSPERFSKATMERNLRYLKRLAQAGWADPAQVIAAVDILSPQDGGAYSRLNATAEPVAERRTVVSWFRDTACRFANKIALSCGGDFRTYRELNDESDQLAAYLLREGLLPGEPVVLYMERSIASVVSLFGILKAGGSYVPVDPTHPADRNAYIIKDTGARYAIASPGLAKRMEQLAESQRLELRILNPEEAGSEQHPDYPQELAQAESIAYLIYTSGSTGTPKGAMIPHRAVVNLVAGIRRLLGWNETDIIAQYSTFSFDASVFDLFGALLLGSHLHLLEDEERFSVESFTAAIAGAQATQIGILPPVFFSRLAAHLPQEAADRYSTVKHLLLGGEALQGQSVRLFQQKMGLSTAIVNVYGPTECTSVTTTHTVDYPLPEHVAVVPIGRPLANYRVYIVNEHNRLCPPGVIGELIIESPGVGIGYLNQPEKTREAFIPDPFDPSSGKRFYRTGDLARFAADGEVEYAGRRDNQVKIRGFRIEVGEIENQFVKHDAIDDCAVVPMADTDGTKMLTAFYTLRSGKTASRGELVDYLAQKLPSYMIPKHFRQLDEFPLSPNRKVDRKALAELGPGEDEPVGDGYVAPRTPLEREIAEAWAQALGRKNLGIRDDFFASGGYSLKILETLVLLKPKFPQLKIADFYANPTVEAMAERIASLTQEAPASQADAASEDIGELGEYPARFGPEPAPLPALVRPHVFLTGATGYLGSQLLCELLKRPEPTVTCLVRKQGAASAYERLAERMEDYFGAEARERMDGRVTVVEGDLEAEGLGLNEAVRDRLTASLDLILHCGAEVRHFGSQDHFARANVDSTRRLLDLAATREGIRFHFISTMGIPEELALAGQWKSFASAEGYDYTAAVDNVYTQSKLEAEKLVVRAGETGRVPATVYRVGNLCCDSATGRFQRNVDGNAFYRMLKAMLLLGRAPRVRWEVDLTPIDYAGWSIVELALQPDNAGRLFHICNPRAVSYEQLVELFREHGYAIEWMEKDAYENWLLQPDEEKDRAGLELAMVHLEGDGAKELPWRYACPQTVSRLPGGADACAKPDRAYVARLIDYAVKIGYFPKEA